MGGGSPCSARENKREEAALPTSPGNYTPVVVAALTLTPLPRFPQPGIVNGVLTGGLLRRSLRLTLRAGKAAGCRSLPGPCEPALAVR